MLRRYRIWFFAVLIVVAALTAAPAVEGLLSAGVPGRAAVASVEQADPLPTVDDLSTAFERVAEAIAPSVVAIRAVKKIEPNFGAQGPDPFFRSPFEDFFGEDFRDRFRIPNRPYVQQGQGSGVIVDDDGYILTNSHVVSGADELTVVLADDREYMAEVIGTDPRTDLAVLKIDAGGLQPARLGDSDDLRVGQWVLASGTPFGLASTLTAGIVSAKGRSRVGVADYEDFIQTDAAINPGNSGGPLVNLRGQVVGINTAIFSRGGGNYGIGFAIPINMAKSVMDDLIANGHVVRGYLGVLIQDLDEGMAQSFGYDGTDGALVSDVTPGGPADEADIEPGDIITRFDGRPVTSIDRLKLDVAAIDPGTEVKVEIFRNGKRRTRDATVGELPTELAASPSRESADVNLGMTVRTLTSEIARQLGLDEAVAGVVVTSVEPTGPAARAGLRSRDVITHVQDDQVSNTSQFRSALRRHDLKDGVRLVVRSGSMRRFVFLQLLE
jgi:serine protease Do